MAAAALALYLAWFVLAFGVRTLIHLRRTGDTGFKGLHGRPGSREWSAGVLLAVALVVGVAAPVAALAGLDPIRLLDPSVLPLDLGFRAEVLLPPAGDDADALPDAGTLVALRRLARAHRVDLRLPRLRAERGTLLIQPLRALGIRRIFSDLCVGGVVAEESLWIAGAYHAAVLRVDETGIEGAAATALVGRGIAYRRLPTIEVRVDRPFLLLVTHQRTGAIAFVARVREP